MEVLLSGSTIHHQVLDYGRGNNWVELLFLNLYQRIKAFDRKQKCIAIFCIYIKWLACIFFSEYTTWYLAYGYLFWFNIAEQIVV